MSVAIIGSGLSGIISCKGAIDNNLKATVFEKESSYGGNWNPQSGKSWENVRLNLSTFNCIFSDFPHGYKLDDYPEDHYENLYPKRDRVYQYLGDYIKKHKMIDHFKFNHLVESIKLLDNEKWMISFQNLKDSTKSSQIFDFLIISTGFFNDENQLSHLKPSPKINIIHSGDYKSNHSFSDKNVLVIGSGNSGVDIACDLSHTAKNLYHYSKRPYYYFPRRITEKNIPFDLLFYSRHKDQVKLTKTVEQRNRDNHNYFNHLCKKQQSIDQIRVNEDHERPVYTSITDDYVDLVDEGKIKVVNDLEQWISDQEQSSEPSTIVVCSGYKCKFPFFSKEILDRLEYSEEYDQHQSVILYKECFPKDLPNMAMVGVFRGTYFATIEIMAHWISRVFSGKLKHPRENPEQFEKGLQDERDIRAQRVQFPHSMVVTFTDSIAREMGVLPDFDQLKVKEPELYQKLWEKPFSLYSYKLYDNELSESEKENYFKLFHDFHDFIEKYQNTK